MVLVWASCVQFYARLTWFGTGPFLDALEFLADFELKPLFITNCGRFFELPMFACVPFQEQYVLNLWTWGSIDSLVCVCNSISRKLWVHPFRCRLLFQWGRLSPRYKKALREHGLVFGICYDAACCGACWTKTPQSRDTLKVPKHDWKHIEDEFEEDTQDPLRSRTLSWYHTPNIYEHSYAR